MSYYYLTEDGKVYNSRSGKYLEGDKKHCVKLLRQDKSSKSITIKHLYKLVYNDVYSNDNIENLNNEEWKVIEGTDKTYYVSNKGRVKSKAGYNTILLKPYITRYGYQRLDIMYDGKKVSKFVHRLVASAFLPLPQNIDYQLHHKDFNSSNNAADNLEWLSAAEHKKKHLERNKGDLQKCQIITEK